jgi:transcriptional regulator with AAA-type ATPase domain
VDHFARQVSEINGWKPKPVRPKPSRELQRYSWPGNVRELRNVVERLLLLADGEVDAAAVRLALPHAATASGAPLGGGTLAARTETYEREVILAELKAPPAHDRHRQSAGPGAQPSVQEVPAARHRFARVKPAQSLSLRPHYDGNGVGSGSADGDRDRHGTARGH